jgi:hypothetical protein
MEDFDALAAALGTGISDVRGCLILSRDGLVLGAHPADAEAMAKPAWSRLSALGEPERGFVQFGTEVWCYVRRGPYAGFALTGTAVRPGLVLDQMDQVLLAAEEARTKGLKLAVPPETPAQAAAPSGKPRTQLHPEPRPIDEPVVIHADASTDAAQVTASSEPGGRSGSTAPAEGGAGPQEAPPEDSEATPEGEWSGSDAGEVDRFSLAREFSQLLQDDEDGADG